LRSEVKALGNHGQRHLWGSLLDPWFRDLWRPGLSRHGIPQS